MSFPSLWCRQPTKDKLGAWNYSRRLPGDGLARVRAKLVADLEKHRSQSFRWTCTTRIFQKRASTKIACASTARRRRRSPHAQEPRSDGASARVCPIVRGVSKHGCCDRERVGREQTPTVDFARWFARGNDLMSAFAQISHPFIPAQAGIQFWPKSGSPLSRGRTEGFGELSSAKSVGALPRARVVK